MADYRVILVRDRVLFVWTGQLLGFLIGLSLITIISGQILNTGREDNGICQEMICYSIEALKHLSNCVVVLGDLKMRLEKANSSSFQGLQFPELREVTGVMAVYWVSGLESLGQLFPNLVRIRGTRLIDNFGLIVNEMPSLKEIGLYSLLKVDRGGVAISGGAHTCFIHTVDWGAIAPNSKHALATEDVHCKTTCTCGTEGQVIKDKCWNASTCQRFLEGPEAEAARGPCHPQCLGCAGDPTHCALCRHFTHERKCVAECPRDTLILKDNQYCVTEEECRDLYGISFDGNCLLECPVEYKRVTHPISGDDICTPCDDYDCDKNCNSLRLQSLSTVQNAESCVYINGSLTIHIKSVPEVMEELRKYLSRIQEVTDYIVIYDSMTITSLDFFSSLKVIRGKKLFNEAYSLVIQDMKNLTSLFSTNVTRNLKIEEGKLNVLRNPMLCQSEIDKIRPLFHEKLNENDLPFEMNGYNRECDGTAVDLHVQVLNETSATLKFSPLPYKKVQYTALYVKLPSSYKKSTLPETCSDSEWYSMSVSPDGVVELKHLHPASTYAVCIEIFVFQPKDRRLSKSNTIRFTTPVGKPAAPFITEIYATSPNNVTLRWVNHKDYRRHITHYELDIFLIEIYPKDVAAKDHCNHIDVAVDEANYSRHAVVLRPPEDYDRSCESLCEQLTSTFAAVVPEEHFKVCDSLDFNEDVYEAPKPKNTSFNIYIRTATIVINSHKEYYQIRDLAPFRDYRFRLRACIGSRCSVSTRAVVRTLRSQDADVPSNVHCSAINYNSIFVEWNSPHDTNGPVLAYIIHVLPIVNGESNITLPRTVCVAANQHNLVVEADSNSTYEVRVCATTLGSVSVCSDWSEVTLPESDNSFLWGGFSFGVLLAVTSVMIGFKCREAADRSDLIPLVEYMSDNNVESESFSLLISTDSGFDTLYTIPLHDTLF